MDDKLEAQLAYLRGDERLAERARAALEMTAVERLHAAYELGAAAMRMLERQPAELRARFEASRERPRPEAAACLRRLGHGGW